jgi:sugar lactone lactonase YvrE
MAPCWLPLALAAGLIAAPASAQVAAPGYSVTMLAGPSPLHDTHGLKVGPDGAIYAASIFGLTIWRIDVKTGEATPFIPSPDGLADDLAFGPDGTLAWTAVVPGIVYARSPGGPIREVLRQPHVNAIGFTRDGRLFVTALGDENKLWEVDITGRKPPRLVMSDIGGLNGFRIDAHNVLWGPEDERGDVVRIDLNTGVRTVVATGFPLPTGVDLDAQGVPYVVDWAAGTLVRIDPATGAKTLVHQFAPVLDNLTLGPDGAIYVSSPSESAIYVVDPKTGAARVLAGGALGSVGGVAATPGADGGDRLYVGDSFSLKRIDGATGALADVGRVVGKPMIMAVNVRAAGAYLLTSHGDTVQMIDPASMAVLRSVKGFSNAEDAVELADGEWVVADREAGKIIAVDAKGGRRDLATGLDQPVGMVLSRGHLYVTEAGAGVVWRMDPGTGAKTKLAEGLDRPEGMDAGPDGRVVVMEAGAGRVVRLEADGRRQVLATGLPPGIKPPAPMPSAWVHNGLAVGARGDVYVTSDALGAVFRISPAR